MRQSQASKGRGNLSEKSCPGIVRARIYADSVVVMHELPTPAVQFGGFRTRQMCRTGLDCGIPRILWCFACIGYSHSGSYPFTTYSPHPFGFRISVPVEKRRIKCPEWSRFLTSDSGNKRADYRALNRVN